MKSLPLPDDVDQATAFDKLRDEHPMCRVTMPSGDSMWLVSRHEDVRHVYSDRRFSRDMTAPGCPRMMAGGDWSENALSMVNMEGEQHTRRRRPVVAHLTPRKIEALRGPTTDLANRLLGELVEAGPPAEFVESFAAPMPALSAALLAGVPESDYDFFRHDVWAVAAPDQHTREEFESATRQIFEYSRVLTAAKRASPGEDMTSDLVMAADAGEFPAEHLPVVIMELMFAGMLNTRSILCAGLLELLRRPQDYRRIAADEEYARTFTEEALRRFAHPTLGLPRLALEDVEVGGVLVAAGEAVVPVLIAANHDPAVFASPESFDPARTDGPHITFGHGRHHCAGAALTRMQLQVAFGAIARKLPSARLTVPEDELPWLRTVLENGVERLPISW